MYLSDRDLRELLPQLQFSTDDENSGFQPDEQIQPCSIDLRLDYVFWVQKRGATLDLSTAKLLELNPRRNWQKRILKPGERIKLRPREMLLGRTLEKFRIPEGYAGKLEGRSSFARMGLSVHCSADFINPGYPGRMPLQLVNHSSHTILLVPEIPICQLIVVQLSSPSEKVYGDGELDSKYFDDDGGPSYWWRDKRIKKLHDSLGRKNVIQEVQERILSQIGMMEPEVVERFESFIENEPNIRLTNAEQLLEQFSNREERTKKLTSCKKGVALWVGPTALTFALGSLLTETSETVCYLIWSVAILFLMVTICYHFFGDPPKTFLGKDELRELRSNDRLNQ